MNLRLTPLWLLGLTALVFGSQANAQAVHNVSSGTGQAFAEIQAAVDASTDGDVLLVSAGTYAPFRVVGKSLSIFGMPGSTVGVDHAGPPSIEVSGLGASQRVVLSGLAIVSTNYYGGSHRLLLLNQNSGHVYLQDCEFQFPGLNVFSPGCDEFVGPNAALILDSDQVSFSQCAFRGGGGSFSDSWCDIYSGMSSSPGGPALLCVRSEVALQGCTLIGGQGGESYTGLRPGGPALIAEDSELYCLNTAITGGPMGNSIWGGYVPGVSAVVLDGLSVLHTLDSPLTGGLGVPVGAPFEGAGIVNGINGMARRIECDTVVPWSPVNSATFHGNQGDKFWMLTALNPKFRLLLPMGILQLDVLLPLPIPSGTLPAGGSLTVPLDFMSLPFSGAPGPVTVQGFALGAGRRWLSGVRNLLALDPASGPDCNSNGMNDYLDILTGTSTDSNDNLVPDECAGG